MTEETRDISLPVYGSRQDVRELSDRVYAMLPSIRELGPDGARAMAQVALALDLNPFTGELYAIPQKSKRTGEVIGFSLMVGIKGLRRTARERAHAMGGVYPFYRPSFRMLDDDEKGFISVGANDKAIACELELILSPGHHWYQNNEFKRFTVTGFGIFRAGEQTRMEHFQVARKRAEADALKMAFDLPFGEDSGAGFEVNTEIVDPDAIDGDYTVDKPFGPESAASTENAPKSTTDDDLDCSPRWPGDYLEMLVGQGLAESGFSANKILEKSSISPDNTLEDTLAWGKYYRGARDQDHDSDTAAKMANQWFASQGLVKDQAGVTI